MADINVERRERSVWPWIIGLIILALIIWLLWSWMGRDRVTDPTAPADTVPVTTDPAVTTPPPPVVDTVPATTLDTPGAPGTPGAFPGEPVDTLP